MAVIKGGDKLSAKLRELSEKVRNPGTLQVGFLENATYPDGTSVAYVAAIQEFGAPAAGILPRPYFRTMVAEKSPTWGKAIGDLLVNNDYDATRTLELTGQGVKGQLQQSIVDFDSVPLAPATVAAKGNDKQLVDTGHMLNSVDYRVK